MMNPILECIEAYEYETHRMSGRPGTKLVVQSRQEVAMTARKLYANLTKSEETAAFVIKSYDR